MRRIEHIETDFDFDELAKDMKKSFLKYMEKIQRERIVCAVACALATVFMCLLTLSCISVQSYFTIVILTALGSGLFYVLLISFLSVTIKVEKNIGHMFLYEPNSWQDYILEAITVFNKGKRDKLMNICGAPWPFIELYLTCQIQQAYISKGNDEIYMEVVDIHNIPRTYSFKTKIDVIATTETIGLVMTATNKELVIHTIAEENTTLCVK